MAETYLTELDYNGVTHVVKDKSALTSSSSLNPSNLSSAVPVAKGGTGATSASSARSNLGLGSAATYSATTSVTSGSSSLVTSGAVYSALENKTSLSISTAVTSLTGYADSLAKGVHHSFAATNTVSDSPVKDNIFVDIYIYSSSTAKIIVYPTGTSYFNTIYTITKTSGTWRSWIKHEGAAVT